MGPLYVRLTDNPASARADDFVLLINQVDTQSAGIAPGASRYLVNHVPTSAATREVLTFKEIADRSQGRSMLGFLKMDVDRLGETFAFGLRGLDTVSRLTTLSRMLDLFFSGWVERLLEKDFPDCYAVFSGGDDLFIIGPWNQTLTLAQRIAKDFDSFTGQPSHLSLSGGLVFGDDHFPVGQAAREADRLVHDAKQAGRARISVLDHTLPWAEFTSIMQEFERMVPDLRQVSQGFLHGLVQYAEMWKGRDLRFQPMLAYALSRETATPAFRRWADQFVGIRPLEDHQRQLLNHLGLLAQLWIFAKRGTER